MARGRGKRLSECGTLPARDIKGMILPQEEKMRKLLLLALSLLICLSATACVTIQTYNFGMAFAEIYATLDLDEIEPLTNGEAYESLAQALEFDRALAGLGEAEFIPLSSTA